MFSPYTQRSCAADVYEDVCLTSLQFTRPECKTSSSVSVSFICWGSNSSEMAERLLTNKTVSWSDIVLSYSAVSAAITSQIRLNSHFPFRSFF